MHLTTEIKSSIDNSVLCWLATVDSEKIPNVSPKEIFNYYETDKIIVANIASPQTVKNIKHNKNVCISFVDILVQKGLQLKGKAEIIDKHYPKFSAMENELLKITKVKYPFATITAITVQSAKPILAPNYMLYPETTEAQQIESDQKIYKL